MTQKTVNGLPRGAAIIGARKDNRVTLESLLQSDALSNVEFREGKIQLSFTGENVATFWVDSETKHLVTDF